MRTEIRKLAAEAGRMGPIRVAVASGKGGAGGTLVLANLGLFLAQIGRRILMVDLARGGGNLHSMLGHEPSWTGPEGGEPGSIDPFIEATPIANLSVIAARPSDRHRPPRLGWRRWLHDEVDRLADRFDGFLFDCGTWPRGLAFDLFVHVPSPMVVVAPEPTGVEGVFGFVRDATHRYLYHHPTLGEHVRRVLGASRHAPPNPAETMERIADRDEGVARELFGHLLGFSPGLVVNKVRVRSDFEVGPAVETVGRRILGMPLRFLGAIEADDAIWKSVRLARPLLVEAPSSKPAREIERIARLILLPDTSPRATLPRLAQPGVDENLYEALEVDRGASEEEIRKAYRRMKEVFSGGSIATRGFVPPAEIRRVLARCEEAYETLVDANLRRPYDRQLLEATGASPEPAAASGGPIDPPGGKGDGGRELVVVGGTEFSGALLREIRRQRGIERDDVAAVTRIGTAYVRAIEDDDFDALPEEVFLKGYLRQIARVLGLAERDVVETYLRRYRAGRRRTARRT
jgi:flagellar biosynthesis protein FlhG